MSIAQLVRIFQMQELRSKILAIRLQFDGKKYRDLTKKKEEKSFASSITC
jgi:hypothetical protein